MQARYPLRSASSPHAIHRFPSCNSLAVCCLQAVTAGKKIKSILDADPSPCKLFFYVSPYKVRSRQASPSLDPSHMAVTIIWSQMSRL